MNPREEYRNLATELETLRTKETRTEAESARLTEVLARMRELEPRVRELAEAEQMSRTAATFAQSAGRPSGENPEGRGEGGAANPAQERNMGGLVIEPLSRIVVKGDLYKQYRQNRQGIQVPVGSFYFDQTKDQDGEPDYIRRADRYALVGASEPATLITPQRIPGIAMATFVRPTVRDAFTNTPTTSNLVQFIREDVASNVNAADFFDETDTDAANVKPESTLAFEEDEAPVRTIATVLPVTDNVIDDVPGFRALLDGRLVDFLKQAEDDALLNGDGTPPEIQGILGTTGVQDLDDAYFATAMNGGALPDAGTANEDINRLTVSMTAIRQDGLAEPTFIIISPAAADFFLTGTDDNRQYLAGNPFTTVGIPRFRGLPIIISNKIADDHALMGDGRMAEVRDRMEARVDIGYVDKQFIKNQKTIRAEERLAFAVLRPAAFADITLTLTA